VSGIHSDRQVGIIVGEAGSNEFYFVSKTEDYPPKWEYLAVYSQEEINGELREVPVVSQVERIVTASQALSIEADIEAVMRMVAAEVHDVRTWGKARVLGYFDYTVKQILQPRRAVTPGRPIYIAPKELLREFYSFPEEEGLHIGSLITRPDVQVHLSLRGFRRHLAIIAQTGAGKSYLAGVLIEELLKKGATVLVLDPHSDYVKLPLTREEARHEFSDRVTVFRNRAATGRYRSLERVTPYEMAFTELSPDEICDIVGIREDATKQRDAVRRALKILANKQYTPADLLDTLEKWQDDDPLVDNARGAARYIRSLIHLNVFGVSSTKISEILQPQHVSVIDLSGLRDESMNYIASSILSNTYRAVSTGEFDFPVFIVIEESHRFIPANDTTYASSIINRIAAEGRKFGIFLILITQRPSKIDADSLSQCNSQIIMRLTNPEDQKAVSRSSERMSQDLLNDLPGLNPGEAIVVGEVTAVPVMIRVRTRMTQEGGADVDVVAKLKEAREKMKNDTIAQVDMGRRHPFRGEFEGV